MILALDLSWFTTIPGMLITGGVLLLIIALVIFIATSGKKGAKDTNAVAQDTVASGVPSAEPIPVASIGQETSPISVVAQPAMTPTVEAPQPVAVQPQEVPVMSTPQLSQEPITPVMQQTLVTTPEVTPVPVVPEPIMAETPVVSTPPMQEQNIAQTIESTPIYQPTPQVQPSAPVTTIDQNTITIPQATAPQEEMPQEVAPVVPQVQGLESTLTPTVMEEQPHAPIYGGVSPIIPNLDVNPHSDRPIYGGANPLQNTQPIPFQSPSVSVTPTPSVPVADQVPQDTVPLPQTVAAPISTEINTPPVQNQAGSVTPSVQAVSQPQPAVQPESLF